MTAKRFALLATAGLLAVAVRTPCAPAEKPQMEDQAPSTTQLHLSPAGRDTWSGRLREPAADGSDGPLASLAGARDTIRRLKAAGNLSGGVTVTIAPGVFSLTETVAFTAEDSGTAEHPVVYSSPMRDSRFSGGRIVTDFAPVVDPAVRDRLTPSARNAVLTADLKALDIHDYGRIANSGFSWKTPLSHMELFFDDHPMRLAQWPNREWTTIAGIPQGKRVVDGSGKRRGVQTDRFAYTGDRPKRWQSLDDVWVHGYWFVDWADQYLRVKALDTDSRMVVIDPPHSPYGYKKGQRFRFLNVLEELDEPGEWYLDRPNGRLYVWPPEGARKQEALVSIVPAPLVTFTNASDVQLVGITLEGGRSDGIRIRGGSRVVVAGCTLRNLGGAGVVIEDGADHCVRSCDIHGLGEGGITLAGGQRQTLTPARHVADNNHIHHFSRWVRTYKAGIRVSGVGNQARHNVIHDAPHSGITYNGNNHLFEYNELARLCLDTGDVGGFYTGRDWTARGTVLRYNYLHHLGGLGLGSNAIYLDDLASGQTVVGNIMHDVWRGLMVGGGRENVVENNVFVGFKIGIHFDARGVGWSKPLIEGRKGGWDMYGRLEAVPYTGPVYSEQYPHLPALLRENPLEPRRNRFARNLFVGKKWLDCRGFTKEQSEARNWATFEANVTDVDPGFVDAGSGDFRLRSDSPALALGFRPIPVDRIGLRVDEYRRELPTR